MQPPPAPITVRGLRGEVIFDGTTVTMRHFLGSPNARTTNTLTLQQVSGVELRVAILSRCLFTLVVPGAVASGRTRNANRKNPLTLEFWRWQAASFEELRDVLVAALRTAQAPATPVRPGASLADELDHLSRLAAAGTITAAEYAQAKARLLGP